jgi:hypothetical protein
VSADSSSGGSLHGVESDAARVLRVLRVQSTFHVADEAQGQAVAAKLIDRAHELANSPECECDLDVSIEWVESDDPVVAPSDVRIGGEASTDRRSAGGHPAAR